MYIVLLSSIFVKHALNTQFVKYILPEKLLDCPKKIILPDSGGGCNPPAHTPENQIKKCLLLTNYLKGSNNNNNDRLTAFDPGQPG